MIMGREVYTHVPGPVPAIIGNVRCPEADAMQRCPTCATPLDEEGKCVTCQAAEEGLVFLTRLDFASIREMTNLLEDAGLGPEMERVPPASAAEVQQPRWNLYVPREEVERAEHLLGSDWKSLLGDEAALEAARRGKAGVNLDEGGEITCPACGHAFVPQEKAAECPDCGLGLSTPESDPGT
jgi:hypothetical protein